MAPPFHYARAPSERQALWATVIAFPYIKIKNVRTAAVVWQVQMWKTQ
jgi:hypothetical protein